MEQNETTLFPHDYRALNSSAMGLEGSTIRTGGSIETWWLNRTVVTEHSASGRHNARLVMFGVTLSDQASISINFPVDSVDHAMQDTHIVISRAHNFDEAPVSVQPSHKRALSTNR